MKKLFSFIFLGLLFLASSCSFKPTYDGSLYITKLPNKVAFNVGDTFTSEGLKIINPKNGEYVTDYILSITDGTILNEVGVFKIDVTKEKYESASFNISVSEMHTMTIDSYPEVEFTVGDYFSISGLIIKDEDGNNVTEYQTSLRVGDILQQAGSYEITITKEGYVSTSYTITVNALDTLEISHLPNKVRYVQGEYFDTTGLLIVSSLDGTTITDYTLSISNGDELKTIGTISVLVSKTGYPQISFDIVVTQGSEPTTHPDTYLDIYYINDTHGSYVRDLTTGSSKYPEAGMAYIGQYMKDKKTANPNNTLLISGGDMFQGGVESNLTDGAIMVDAMNEIGFDAMICGNHEFDWKPSVIAERVAEMNFPLLSCNIFDKGTTNLASFLKPYTVLNKDGYKVGIIGAGAENLGSSVLASISSQFSWPSPEEYIKKCSDELRTSYQCDVVLLVSHDGGTTSSGSSTLSDDYSDLVYTSSTSGKKYVDAIMFAHDHYRKNFSCNNVPVVESACNGEYIANIKLNLTYGTDSYVVDTYNVSGLDQYAYKYCTTANTYIDTLPSTPKYYAQIGDPERVLYHFDTSYTESEFATFSCQILYWYASNHKSDFGNTTVYLADINTGAIRTSVASGDFTIRNLIKVCPFDNDLAIQKCSSSNVNRIKSFAYYMPGTPIYTSNYTYGISVSYVVEKYSYLQSSYTYYGSTMYDAYLSYFESVN